MLLAVINVGLLIALFSIHRKFKRDVLIALLFGTIKALIAGSILTARHGVEALPLIVLQVVISGLITFLACWGFLVLLGRTDRLELAYRRAVMEKRPAKKPAMVLEWIGIAVLGIFTIFS